MRALLKEKIKTLLEKMGSHSLENNSDQTQQRLLPEGSNHTIIQINDRPTCQSFLNHDVITVICEFLDTKEISAFRLTNNQFLEAFYSSPESKVRMMAILFDKAGAASVKSMPACLDLYVASPQTIVRLSSLSGDNKKLLLNSVLAEVLFFSNNDTFDKEMLTRRNKTFEAFCRVFTNPNHTAPANCGQTYDNALKNHQLKMRAYKIKILVSMVMLLSSSVVALYIAFVNGGSLMLTMLNMDDCISPNSDGEEGSLAADGSINRKYEISCPALRQMPQYATWPAQPVYGCIDGNTYGPWSVAELIIKHCLRYEKECSSLLSSSISSRSASDPGDWAIHAIGEYCTPNISAAVVFVFYAALILSMSSAGLGM